MTDRRQNEDSGWTDEVANSDSDHERDDLAEARTQMAEDRTILANERTYAGWMRTAFAAVGIGLAFNALFTSMEPWWVPRSIASVFFLLGIYIFIAAERRACAVQQRLHSHKVETVQISRLRFKTAAASLAVAALIVALWMLPIDR